jgi:hypothetical protein
MVNAFQAVRYDFVTRKLGRFEFKQLLTPKDGGLFCRILSSYTLYLFEITWRALGDSNPCYRRERAVS